MNYQTFEPSFELADFVKCYWTLENPAEDNPVRQTIVPDGCMEMIFHRGDIYRQFSDNNESVLQPRAFVFGQLTRPLEIAPTGETNIFSVRFRPEGFVPFANMHIKEMENKAVSLEIIFGEEARALENIIVNAESTTDMIAFIETFLIKRLAAVDTIDRVVQSTVDTILSANGQLPIDELSEQNNIHRRQLERKFSSTIGLSPKQLSKTVRLQATLKLLLRNEFTTLTELAYEGEYYDQAHFIKDFKEFTGMTPKEFYGDKLKMSTLFYGE